MWLRTLLLLCFVFWHEYAALAQEPGGAAASLPTSDMSWWYRAPATKFWEGLPLGTGRFAAMVYGRVPEETIVFNDETLWAGSPHDPVNPNGLKTLPAIRKAVLEGRYALGRNQHWLARHPLAGHEPVEELRRFIPNAVPVVVHAGERHGRGLADQGVVVTAQDGHFLRHAHPGGVARAEQPHAHVVRRDGDRERLGQVTHFLDQPALCR